MKKFKKCFSHTEGGARQKDYFEFETCWRPFIADLGHQRFHHKVKFVYWPMELHSFVHCKLIRNCVISRCFFKPIIQLSFHQVYFISPVYDWAISCVHIITLHQSLKEHKHTTRRVQVRWLMYINSELN